MVSMYQDKEIIDKTKELVKTIKDDSLYKLSSLIVLTNSLVFSIISLS